MRIRFASVSFVPVLGLVEITFHVFPLGFLGVYSMLDTLDLVLIHLRRSKRSAKAIRYSCTTWALGKTAVAGGKGNEW